VQKRFLSNLFDYVIPLITLSGYMLLVLVSDKLPSKYDSFLAFSVVLFSIICGALMTGEIGIRGYGVVNKIKRPNLYWTQVGILFLFAAIFTTFALLCK